MPSPNQVRGSTSSESPDPTAGVIDELTIDFGESEEVLSKTGIPAIRTPLALRWFIGQPFGLSEMPDEREETAAAELEASAVGLGSKDESSSQSEGNSPPSLLGSAFLLADPFLLFTLCLGMAGAKR